VGGWGGGGMRMVCKTSCNFSVKNKLFPVIIIFIACDLHTDDKIMCENRCKIKTQNQQRWKITTAYTIYYIQHQNVVIYLNYFLYIARTSYNKIPCIIIYNMRVCHNISKHTVS